MPVTAHVICIFNQRVSHEHVFTLYFDNSDRPVINKFGKTNIDCHIVKLGKEVKSVHVAVLYPFWPSFLGSRPEPRGDCDFGLGSLRPGAPLFQDSFSYHRYKIL